MSSDIVIRVSNLGKKYHILHQTPERYTTLRDVITCGAAAPFHRLVGAVKGYLLPANGHTPRDNLQRLTDNRSSDNPSPDNRYPSIYNSFNGSAVEDFWALRDVSFEVRRGEVLGVIGRNGAGKSTLLKILSRITAPTTGTVEIEGRVASLLEVGTGFHPELTGRDNIFLNGAILGMTRAEIRKRFDEIVAFAEVEKFLDTPVKRFSSGMYMRLAFAVAAHLEPDVLVIDEVLSVGDALFQNKCLDKMKEVAGHGRTVVFVSHNMMAIATLCSSGLLLQHGHVETSGPVAHCVTVYSDWITESTSEWTRPLDLPHKGPLSFTKASLVLGGEQPAHTLSVKCETESYGAHRPAFLAVDILNHFATGIMQALPTLEGVISDGCSRTKSVIDIALPPLVPGHYRISLWIGPHNTVTYDKVSSILGFDIMESPTLGRSYPHSPELGSVVPLSSVMILQ